MEAISDNFNNLIEDLQSLEGNLPRIKKGEWNTARGTFEETVLILQSIRKTPDLSDKYKLEKLNLREIEKQLILGESEST